MILDGSIKPPQGFEFSTCITSQESAPERKSKPASSLGKINVWRSSKPLCFRALLEAYLQCNMCTTLVDCLEHTSCSATCSSRARLLISLGRELGVNLELVRPGTQRMELTTKAFHTGSKFSKPRRGRDKITNLAWRKDWDASGARAMQSQQRILDTMRARLE